MVSAAGAALLTFGGIADALAGPAEDLTAAAKKGDLAAAGTALAVGAPTKGPAAGEAIRWGAWLGNEAMVELLLKHGVPVDEPGRDTDNALMAAAAAGREEMVAYLLNHGAKASYVGKRGTADEHAAIFGALRKGSTEIVEMLLDHGADANAGGGYAVEGANAMGNVALYQRFLKMGGKPWTVHPAIKHAIPGAAAAEAALQTRPAPAAFAGLGLAELLPEANPVAARPAAATSGKRPRVAILSDGPNFAAADLLTAELTSTGAVDLLERTEIGRILAEQQLNADFATDAANAGKIGDLLGADVLVLIQNRFATAGAAVECRVVRVHPGLVLDSSHSPAPLADRAAETASALGLDTPEVGRLEIEALARLIQKTGLDLAARIANQVPPGDPLDRSDPFHNPFRGPECPTPEDYFGLATHCVDLYSAALESASAANDADFDAWLKIGPQVAFSAMLPIRFTETARERMRLAEALRAYAAKARDLAAKVVELPAHRKGDGEILFRAIESFVNTLDFWTASPAERVAAARSFLPCHFAARDLEHRIAIRRLLARGVLFELLEPTAGGGQVAPGLAPWEGSEKTRLTNQATLLQALSLPELKEPEDRVFAAILELRIFKKDLGRQAKVKERLLFAMQEMAPRLAAEPAAIPPCLELAGLQSAPAAPEIFCSDPEQRPMARHYLPEILDFRRHLLLDICGQTRDARTLSLLIDPKEYSEAQIEEWRAAIEAHLARNPAGPGTIRNYAEQIRQSLQGLGPAPAPASEPLPPLQVTRLWHPEGVVSAAFADGAVYAEGSVWLCSNTEWEESARVYRVELPSLKTTTIPLPGKLRAREGSAIIDWSRAGLLVDPDALFVTVPGLGLFLYDRKAEKWQANQELNPAEAQQTRPRIMPVEANGAVDLRHMDWQMVRSGDSLYVITADPTFGLAKVKVATGAAELIASTRRNPAASPLDLPGSSYQALELLASGEIEVTAFLPGDKPYVYQVMKAAYAPQTGKWRQTQAPKAAETRPTGRITAVMRGFDGVGSITTTAPPGGDGVRHGRMLLDGPLGHQPSVPLLMTPPAKLSDSEQQNLRSGPRWSWTYGKTPQGYIFPEGTDMFWFLPAEELAQYLKQNPGAAAGR